MIVAVIALWTMAGFLFFSTVKQGRPTVWVAVLVSIVAMWVTRIEINHNALEARLVDAAVGVSERPMKLNCVRVYNGRFTFTMYEGMVPYTPDDPRGTGDVVYLRNRLCSTIGDWMNDGYGVTDRVAAAVGVLTHEAVHVSGIRDEAETECVAMQRMSSVARALGADTATATELAAMYHSSVYPLMGLEYRSDECTPEGSMDLGLGDGPWP